MPSLRQVISSFGPGGFRAAQAPPEAQAPAPGASAVDGRWLAVAHAAGLGAYELDCASGDSAWSPVFGHLVGWPSGAPALTTEEADALVHPDDRERFLDKLLASLDPAGAGEFEDDYRIVRPDGGIRWVKAKGGTVFASHGGARRPLVARGVILDITGNRPYKRALVESREELDVLVASALAAIITIDADQRIIRFNPSAERMFRCSAEQAIGSRVERFMPARFRATHADKVRRFVEGEISSRALEAPRRFVGLRADGEEFLFESTVTKVEVEGQLRLTAFIRDITDRVEAESALQRSMDDLELALRGARAGIWNWDMRSGRIEWSPGEYALFGIRAGEALDMGRIFQAVHPDDRPAVEAALHWEKGRSTEYNAEFRVVWPDGSVHWLGNLGSFVVDEEGAEATGMHGVSLDISPRKQAQQALLASEAQLSAIFEHAAVGMAHISLPERRVPRVNEALCRILGYTRDELLGLTLNDLTWPEDRAIGVQDYDRLVRGEIDSFIKEKRYVRKNGKLVWVRATISAVRDESGAARFAIGVFEDTTEARNALQAREEAERRLELAVSIAEVNSWEWELGSGHVRCSEWSGKPFDPDRQEALDLRRDWAGLVHPDDRERILRYIDDYAADPQPEMRMEFRLFRPGVGYRWLASRGIPMRDAGGRVVKVIGTEIDITERKESEQRVREAALHDTLTGLPNRALVFEYGGHLLAAAQRSHGRGALLFIDLDRFKPINDLYGHEVGDRVLQEVGKRLVACTRQEDLVGRLGGDEFIIVLPNLSANRYQAIVVAQHVLEEFKRPMLIDALALTLSPSIGISHYPEHGTDVGTLIRAADLAMYRAKQAGRGSYQLYTTELDRRAEEALSLEARLKAALAHGGLSLYYQPVVDIECGKSIGAEALVRLRGKDGETISPVSFIPIAESTGLIGELGEWVATEACRQLRAWRHEGLQVEVAINVSPLQFRRPDFAERLRNIIACAGIDPACLQLEVTESTLMESVDEAVEILHGIKALGVKVALDDFGTGYSSLSRLSSLPLDKLKVDQSFVRHIDRDQASRAVTEAIIALGRTLHLDIVGEGIESESALRYLREHGCNQAQGFWFSRPLPAPEFARWYRRQQAV